MISLTSEITDTKGRHARGWLFFDAECEFCTRIAAWMERPMQRRGLALAPLQDSRVAALLGLPAEELLQEIRYINGDGKKYAGADALVGLAREFWWARPVIVLALIPHGMHALRVLYAWVARQRNCHARMHCDRPANAG
jgi:predicted DCC family thiol-disulfide oxidoreductase YuxK